MFFFIGPLTPPLNSGRFVSASAVFPRYGGLNRTHTHERSTSKTVTEVIFIFVTLGSLLELYAEVYIV